MAIAMAHHGGIGILHRNLSIEDQAHQVDLVKRTQTGRITNPVTIGPEATLEDFDALCGQFRVSVSPSSTRASACWASAPTVTCASSPSPSGPPPVSPT